MQKITQHQRPMQGRYLGHQLQTIGIVYLLVCLMGSLSQPLIVVLYIRALEGLLSNIIFLTLGQVLSNVRSHRFFCSDWSGLTAFNVDNNKYILFYSLRVHPCHYVTITVTHLHAKVQNTRYILCLTSIYYECPALILFHSSLFLLSSCCPLFVITSSLPLKLLSNKTIEHLSS